MTTSAKSSSEKTLATYFMEMSRVSVPTLEEEVESFRRLLDVESKMAFAFLRQEGSEESLRAKADEDGVELPGKLTEGARVKPEVLDFIRMTDGGRDWLQECIEAAAGDAVVRPLIRKRDSIKNAFIAANLRLTVSTAKKYSKHCKHQGLGDLIQEGNIGLMKAVDRFDPARGYRFATYATWWIRHHIKRAMADKEKPIRIPVHVADLASKLSRLDGNHMAETGEGMDASQMAKAANVPLKKVMYALASKASVAHLDAPVGEEESMTLLDTVASDAFPDPMAQFFKEQLRIELLELLSGLTPIESRIIRYRFGFDSQEKELTLQEIADQYNLSRERIRQIESKALEKLKGRMRSRRMDEYLLEAG